MLCISNSSVGAVTVSTITRVNFPIAIHSLIVLTDALCPYRSRYLRTNIGYPVFCPYLCGILRTKCDVKLILRQLQKYVPKYKLDRRCANESKRVPTVQSHSIAVGKYGHRPLNHAVRELGLKVLARQIVHRAQREYGKPDRAPMPLGTVVARRLGDNKI